MARNNDNKDAVQNILDVFGASVKSRRNELGFTRDQLAERVMISVDMIGRVERGTNGLNFKHIANLAEALNCTIPYLFGGRDFIDNREMKNPTNERDRLLKEIHETLLESSTDSLRTIKSIVQAVNNGK